MYAEIRIKVVEAVARGWCHDENANKVMDTELANAIVEEVMLSLIRTGILTK